jgi:hypothetical protein
MKKSIPLFLILIFPILSKSQNSLRTPISAFVFLTLNAPDARHGGMGDAGVATPSDETDYYWNPAKTAFSLKRIGFFFAPQNLLPLRESIYVGNTYFRNFSGFYKLNGKEAISVFFCHTNQSFTLVNDNTLSFVKINSDNTPQWTLGLNYSRKISNH